jgi:hypothetical protein
MDDFSVNFYVHSAPFWNKFKVDEALSIKESLQHNLASPLVRAEFLFSTR